MKILLEGYFFGVSKKGDFESKKTGQVYSDYPVIQFLVLTPTDFIGERAELVNIKLVGSSDDSAVSNYYQKTRDLIGKFCTLIVNQERYKKDGVEITVHNTSHFPKKIVAEDVKPVSPIATGQKFSERVTATAT